MPLPTFGETINLYRGDTFTWEPERQLGDISTRTKLWFTVKQDHEDVDSESKIMIEETAGLLYINGATAETAANGDIDVTDQVLGVLTVELSAVETAKLTGNGKWYYDIQALFPTGVTTLLHGELYAVGDVARVTS